MAIWHLYIADASPSEWAPLLRTHSSPVFFFWFFFSLFFLIFVFFNPIVLLSLSFLTAWSFSCAHMVMCQTHIYIYIYICLCCEVIIWAKFGHFRCYYLGQVGVIIWAKLFLAYKNSGFKRFLHTQLSFSVFFCAQLSGSYLKIAFFKKWVQKLGFSNFCVLS